MSQPFQKPGQISASYTLYRNRKKLTSGGKSADLSDYIVGFEIFESMTSSTMEATFLVMDAGGLINSLTGSELIKVDLKTGIQDRTYYFRIYQIVSRSRGNQNTEIYMMNAVSDEFLKNEITNIFGHSGKIFGSKNPIAKFTSDVTYNNNKNYTSYGMFAHTEASQIIKKIIKDKKYLGSSKKLFLEETLNKHAFIATNWRPFDTIYWISQRSIRKSKKGGTLQNGFAFYENALGYNFKSIDKIIEDVNDQDSTATNLTTGTARLYEYEYSPKQIGDGSRDQWLIDKIVFPDEKNFLMGLRHGAWSGFSIGYDPASIGNSKMGLSTDMSYDAYRYNISTLWPKMSHIGGNTNINPIKNMDRDVQRMINYPKRVRYTAMPNQMFDPKYKRKPQRNYEELVELQAYQWLRLESLKTVQLMIQVPGNFDLYAGCGVKVIIPSIQKQGTKIPVDSRYSGRYVIAGISHKTASDQFTTELMLVKDTVHNITNIPFMPEGKEIKAPDNKTEDVSTVDTSNLGTYTYEYEEEIINNASYDTIDKFEEEEKAFIKKHFPKMYEEDYGWLF